MNTLPQRLRSEHTSAQARTVNLKKRCEAIVERFPDIQEIWLFGSRQQQTRSVRSDIDVLIRRKHGATFSYDETMWIRKLEPYLDCFTLHKGVAQSFLTNSRISAKTNKRLISRLGATPVWRKDWISGELWQEHDVLGDRNPAMSFAFIFPELEDPADTRYDGIVMTALHEEFEALVEVFEPAELFRVDIENASHSAVAEVRSTSADPSEEPYRVLLTWAGGPGPSMSAAHATISLFSTKAPWIIMTGIAAGLEGDINLGDVLIPTHVIDYEVAKVTAEGARPSPTTYASSKQLERVAQALSSHFVPSSQALSLRPSSGRLAATSIVTGAKLASGTKVIGDRPTAMSLKNIDRNIKAVEMEGSGVGAAAHVLGRDFLVAKAICDYADENKDDSWHSYASRVSAEFVHEMIRSMVSDQAGRQE